MYVSSPNCSHNERKTYYNNNRHAMGRASSEPGTYVVTTPDQHPENSIMMPAAPANRGGTYVDPPGRTCVTVRVLSSYHRVCGLWPTGRMVLSCRRAPGRAGAFVFDRSLPRRRPCGRAAAGPGRTDASPTPIHAGPRAAPSLSLGLLRRHDPARSLGTRYQARRTACLPRKSIVGHVQVDTFQSDRSIESSPPAGVAK